MKVEYRDLETMELIYSANYFVPGARVEFPRGRLYTVFDATDHPVKGVLVVRLNPLGQREPAEETVP